jgi:hypothetical protein
MKNRSFNEVINLPDEAIVNIAEAALLMRRHPETLRRWRLANLGPRYLTSHNNAKIEYLVKDIRNWIEGRRSET